MHPNPSFRKPGRARNLDFARARGFGALIANGEAAPLVAHVPFWLAQDGSHAEMHLLRSNPLYRVLGEGCAARLVITGEDGYVSPDWYEVPDQVPTWNYIAVHLAGHLERAAPEELEAHLARLSARFEADLAPKPAWTMGKMDPEILARMMRTIAPVRLSIEDVEGTWKLNQNKPDEVRQRAARETEAAGRLGLAALMADPPEG